MKKWKVVDEGILSQWWLQSKLKVTEILIFSSPFVERYLITHVVFVLESMSEPLGRRNHRYCWIHWIKLYHSKAVQGHCECRRTTNPWQGEEYNVEHESPAALHWIHFSFPADFFLSSLRFQFHHAPVFFSFHRFRWFYFISFSKFYKSSWA